MLKIKEQDTENKDKPDKKISLKERTVVAEKFTFNFSFITTRKEYNIRNCEPKVKKKLLEKLESLSSDDIVAIMALPREQGMEIMSENEVNISPNSDFISSGRAKKAHDGYYIFRLNTLGRVIGKVIENVFYIIAIDTKFDLYKH